ncbi:hypothetical protein CKQ90_28315, partial [Klebsiella pneumoniae]
SVELEGTLRTHSSEVQQRVKARVSEIAAGFASAFGAGQPAGRRCCRAWPAGRLTPSTRWCSA